MRKMFKYLRPYRGSIFLVLILIFLQSMSSLYLPTLMSNIVDTGVRTGNVGYIVRVGAWMLLVAVAGVGCSVLAGMYASKVSANFGKVLRRDVFTRVENFTLHEFDGLGTASLITRTTNDVTQVQQLVNMMLRMMVMAPLTMIGGVLMAVITNARLSLVIVVVIPVLGLTIFSVLWRGLALFQVIQTKIDNLNRVLREMLTGVRVIRSFHRTRYEEARFDRANQDLTDTSVRVNQIMASLMPAMMLIINFSTLAIIWFGGMQMNSGDLQVGNLMAFLQYLMQILFAVMMVSMMFFMIPRASASAARIHEVLETVPTIVDAGEVRTVSAERGHVEFKNVTFSYPGAEQPALMDISFAATKGQVTAIIGGTGAGKSTILNLIPRFYDVDSGSILVDGVDVRALAQSDLRARLGLVPQTAVLFSLSVADNIRYGKPEATQEEVVHAATVAQAAEFIRSLPEGYDSLIAQGGKNLSGGQKQRLAIARALIRRPEVYLFDDSFSALDFKTDARLRAALHEEVQDATVIIVAQRVSTVIDADQIVVLDDGRVVDIGRHEDLLARCSVYQEIVASQLTEEEIA